MPHNSKDNKENYQIGYCKPPKNTQFKKGKSGNGKGRPKKKKNTYSILESELDKIIVLKENGKEIKLTKRQAMLRHMVNKAVQGDSKAMFFVFNQLLQLDQKEELTLLHNGKTSPVNILFEPMPCDHINPNADEENANKDFENMKQILDNLNHCNKHEEILQDIIKPISDALGYDNEKIDIAKMLRGVI